MKVVLQQDNIRSQLETYDVIIVGTGFAALPIALSLEKFCKVLLIEGGGKDYDPLTEELTYGDDYGHFTNGYWSQHWVRSFGGTSSRWSGWITPLEETDFEGINGLPLWPIRYSDLSLYYKRAAEFLGRDPGFLTQRYEIKDSPFVMKPSSGAQPLRLERNYFQRIVESKTIHLLLNTNLLKLHSTSRQKIDAVTLSDQSSEKIHLTLRPDQPVVLACGGMGNAQILLQPHATEEVPIGAESGYVGNFLMEHPHAVCGDLLIERDFFPEIPESFSNSFPSLILKPEIQKKNELLSCLLDFRASRPQDFEEEIRFLESRHGITLQHYQVASRSEQEPQKSNRLILTNDRNSAGLYRLRTQCVFSSRDLATIEHTVRLLGEFAVRARKGSVRINNDGIYRRASGGGHTLGTTRMGSTMEDSVCDKTLKVHGYENLFLSGSSVFPTGGSANPTLTIVALALRLADSLKEKWF